MKFGDVRLGLIMVKEPGLWSRNERMLFLPSFSPLPKCSSYQNSTRRILNIQLTQAFSIFREMAEVNSIPKETPRFPFDEITVQRHKDESEPLSDYLRHYLHTLPFLSPSSVLVFSLLLLASLHGAGLFLFTRGFLLTRLALEDRNECSTILPSSGVINLNCTLPPTHLKMVLIIIDALRADFLFPVNQTSTFTPSPFYHNHLSLPAQLTSLYPSHSFLSHFIADAPTTTLQRLKGLTTGSLPTFVDAGSNFAGEKVGEDNWLYQAKKSGKKIALIGDETWLNVFPLSSSTGGGESVWEENLVFPDDSFNVEDLDTVDRGVVEHLLPMLDSSSSSTNQWDIIIAHSLGLDHAGHRFGPEHYEMTRKLKETQSLLERVVGRLDDDTLLVVMGDHGMTDRGDHGGDSREEIEAGLWIYSKGKELTHSSWFDESSPRNNLVKESVGAGELGDQLEVVWKEKGVVENQRSVAQVDLVPTLSLLLGLPIPFGSLGLVIPDLFYHSTSIPSSSNLDEIPKKSSSFFSRVAAKLSSQEDEEVHILSPIQSLLQAHFITSTQLSKYLTTYTSTSSGSDLLPSMNELNSLLSSAQLSHSDLLSTESDITTLQLQALEDFWTYSRKVREKARSIWAKFDEALMIAGLLVYLGSVLVGMKFWRVARVGNGSRHLLGRGIEGALVAGWITIALRLLSVFKLLGLDFSLTWISLPLALGAELGVLLGPSNVATVKFIRQFRWKKLLPILPLIVHSAIFTSNSFTVFEDATVLLVLTTILAFTLLRSFAAPEARLRKRLISFTLIAIVCVRLMAYSTICREEQMPNCHVTFHFAAGSLGALVIVGLAFIAAWFIPTILRASLALSASDTSIAPLFLGGGIRSLLILAVGYWAVDWSIAGLNLGESGISFATTIKTGLARTVMVGSILSAFLIWYTLPLCLTIQKDEIKDSDGKTVRTTVKFIGFANTFGSTYLLYFSSLFTLIFLVNPPPAQLILTLHLIVILCLLEIFDSERDVDFMRSSFSFATMEALLNNEPPTPPSHTGPTFIQLSTLALLSHLSFFSTGHQASLSTIQWSTAFIGFPTLMYPFSPVLVVLNTLGPFIITALSIPLFVFWALSPHLKDQAPMYLLRNLLKASAGYMTYQAIVGFSSALWAGWFRRHLMVWKIFGPRFMLGIITVLMTDFVVVMLAVSWGSWVTIGKVKALLKTRIEE